MIAEADYAACVELDRTSEALRADLLRVQTEKANSLKNGAAVNDPNPPSAAAAAVASALKMPTGAASGGQVASAC